jgi:flagellar basal body rod protein FlgF
MNKGTACTLTVPKNSAVAFSIGTTIAIRQKGAGQVTIAPVDGDVILNYPVGLKISNQYGIASLIKIDTNIWSVIGSLEV